MPHRYGRRVLESHTGRFSTNAAFVACSVGKGPEIVATPEHLITWLKLLYVSADRFNPPRHVNSQYLVFWF